MKQLFLMLIAKNTDDFKSFKCKTELIGNTVPQPVAIINNGIVENATISVLFKYLSNF